MPAQMMFDQHLSGLQCNPDAETMGPSVPNLPSVKNSGELGALLFDALLRLQPTPAELNTRMQLRLSLQKMLQKALGPDTTIYIFGSEVLGLLRRDSDMDMYVGDCHVHTSLPVTQQREILNEVWKALRRDYQVVFIPHAKVPILKHSQGSPPHFDISCNWNGVVNSHFLRQYTESHPPTQALILAVVKFAKAAGIHGAQQNGLKSYTIVLMVIYFLLRVGQIEWITPVVPSSIVPNPPPLQLRHGTCNPEWLANTLTGFMQFFGEAEHTEQFVISIRQQGYLTKKEKRWRSALAVEDPLEPHINTSEHIQPKHWADIQTEMRNALTELRRGLPIAGFHADNSRPRTTRRGQRQQRGRKVVYRPLSFHEVVQGQFVESLRVTRVTDVLHPRYYAPVVIRETGRASSCNAEEELTEMELEEEEDESDMLRGFLRKMPAFLLFNPPNVSLRKVKTRFKNEKEYLNVILNNMQAEYFQVYCELLKTDCSAESVKSFTATMTEVDILEARNNAITAEGLSWCLVAVVSTTSHGTHCSLHLVDRQTPDPSQFETMACADTAVGAILPTASYAASTLVDCEVQLRIKPQLPFDDLATNEVRVHALDYIGGYMKEYLATQKLMEQVNQDRTPEMLTCVRDPLILRRGTFNDAPPIAGEVDYSQARVLQQLKWCLEGIQGPPGTGKSWLVRHMIDRIIPPGHILVTAQTNVAIDAVCEQLGARNDIVVIGKYTKMDYSLDYRLPQVVDRHPLLRGVKQRLKRIEGLQELLQRCLTILMGRTIGHLQHRRQILAQQHGALNQQLSRTVSGSADLQSRLKNIQRQQCLASGYQKVLVGMLRRVHSPAWALRQWLAIKHRESLEQLEIIRESAAKTVLRQTRVFLCTLHSIPRLMNTYRDFVEEPLKIHTIFLDEAGCAIETAIPLALLTSPVNLILLGDPAQLPPFTVFQQKELRGTRYDRSLLQRIADARQTLPMLTTQYRMHPAICDVVSRLFYQAKLITADVTVRARPEPVAVWWLQSVAEEKTVGTSIQNEGEARVVYQVCLWLRQHRPNMEILVLTFYKAQVTTLCSVLWGDTGHNELQKVRILSVDSSQGQQADIVVLSCVRTSTTLGFTTNLNRMCVAFSRARHMLVTVGNATTFKGNSKWLELVEASCCIPAEAPVDLRLAVPEFSDPLLCNLWLAALASSGAHQIRRLRPLLKQLFDRCHVACPVLSSFGWTPDNVAAALEAKDVVLQELWRWEVDRRKRLLQYNAEVLALVGHVDYAPTVIEDEYDFM